MLVMNTVLFLSLIIIHVAFGHKIHKRLLENETESSTRDSNKEILDSSTTTKTPETEPVSNSTKKLIEVVLPLRETIGHKIHKRLLENEVESSTHDSKTEIVDLSTTTNSPRVDRSANSTKKPLELLRLHETIVNHPLEIKEIPSQTNKTIQPRDAVEENGCHCFTIRKPGTLKNSKSFENATTSILSEIESEIGFLFEIAANVLPKTKNDNESTTINVEYQNFLNGSNSKPVLQTNNSDLSEDLKIEKIDVPLFDDFMPFFPLEGFIGNGIPHETIVIKTESEFVDPVKIFPKLAKVIANKNEPNQNSSSSTQQEIENAEKKAPKAV